MTEKRRRAGRSSPRSQEGAGALPRVLEAPEIRRGIHLNRMQWVGLPLLLVMPVLAGLELVGDRDRDVAASAPGFELRVRYPERFHYSTNRPLEATVTNVASAPLPGVTLRFARDYLSRFSDVRVTPDAARPTASGLDVELPGIGPGQSARVSVQLQGETYGRHRGVIVARTLDGRVAQVEVSTLVLP